MMLDPVRGNTCVGYTSVTSSMPSSTYMTSCIVSWWYSTISRRNLFSRAYTEFSCASRAFSANSVSNWRRICKSNEQRIIMNLVHTWPYKLFKPHKCYLSISRISTKQFQTTRLMFCICFTKTFLPQGPLVDLKTYHGSFHLHGG